MRPHDYFIGVDDDSGLGAGEWLLLDVGMCQHPFADHFIALDDLPPVCVSIPPDVVGANRHREGRGPVRANSGDHRDHLGATVGRRLGRIRASGEQQDQHGSPADRSA